jgi:hypothetical protein
MQIKILNYNFSKFYANIIYELLRNLTNLRKFNLLVKKPISYKLYTNSYVSYISIIQDHEINSFSIFFKKFTVKMLKLTVLAFFLILFQNY